MAKKAPPSVQWICGTVSSLGVTGTGGMPSALLNFRFPESTKDRWSFYVGADVNPGAFASFAEIAGIAFQTGHPVAVGYVLDGNDIAWAHILNVGGPADTCHVLKGRGKELYALAEKDPKIKAS